MKYLKFTNVDAVTSISIFISPAVNGPAFPVVADLQFGFALESEYPTSHPIFYGTASDDADLTVSGVIESISEADYDAAKTAELAARASIATAQLTDQIATRRFTAETSGIIWNGFFIDTDRDSQPKIQSARTAAKDGLRKDDAVWKCGDPKTSQPVYRVTTNAEMIDIGNQAYDYIQACYDREGALMAAVAGGTYTVDMLNEGWPT